MRTVTDIHLIFTHNKYLRHHA